jgi:hypothetical protein
VKSPGESTFLSGVELTSGGRLANRCSLSLASVREENARVRRRFNSSWMRPARISGYGRIRLEELDENRAAYL